MVTSDRTSKAKTASGCFQGLPVPPLVTQSPIDFFLYSELSSLDFLRILGAMQISFNTSLFCLN